MSERGENQYVMKFVDFVGGALGKKEKNLLCLHLRISDVGFCPVCLNCKDLREYTCSSV